MAKCDILLTFQGTAADLIDRARTSIVNQGGTFSGNESAGQFTVSSPLGNISATYTINAQELTVLVMQKPTLVSCKRIESFLREQVT